MVSRPHFIIQIHAALKRGRVVALLGPRQCGKTTLARRFVDENSVNYFDLEDPTSLLMLENPMTTLSSLRGLVVIDEIQRKPQLFSTLRVLSDRKPLKAKFLLLGSASHELLQQSSESLAGRIEFIELTPFMLDEISLKKYDTHWLRGGFPLSFLAKSHEDSFNWRKNFIKTFLEKDVLQWGVKAPPLVMHRFWAMLAHYHAQIFNAAEFSRSLGVNESTIRRYLDLLSGAYIIRQLKPWHQNLGKRQVKAPKIYFRDSGLLHSMLQVRVKNELLFHPKIGASYEGYVIETLLQKFSSSEGYFWATHSGAELDLLLFHKNKRIGFEIKLADAPKLTASMKIAFEDLQLDNLIVLYPGKKRYPLAEKIEAIPFLDYVGL